MLSKERKWRGCPRPFIRLKKRVSSYLKKRSGLCLIMLMMRFSSSPIKRRIITIRIYILSRCVKFGYAGVKSKHSLQIKLIMPLSKWLVEKALQFPLVMFTMMTTSINMRLMLRRSQLLVMMN